MNYCGFVHDSQIECELLTDTSNQNQKDRSKHITLDDKLELIGDILIDMSYSGWSLFGKNRASQVYKILNENNIIRRDK